jgi:hypothetical protein
MKDIRSIFRFDSSRARSSLVTMLSAPFLTRKPLDRSKRNFGASLDSDEVSIPLVIIWVSLMFALLVIHHFVTKV